MAFTFVENSALISTTEYSLVNNSTTLASSTEDALLQTWVDLTGMSTANQYRVRITEETQGGLSSQGVVAEATFTGAQPGPWAAPTFLVGNGWDCRVTLLAGPVRLIRWSLRKIT